MKLPALFLIAYSVASPAFGQEIPHLDPEMSSQDYRSFLSGQQSTLKSLDFSESPIEEALRLGNRLSAWIGLLNEGRTPGTMIRLSSPDIRGAFPVERPNIYSAARIKAQTQLIFTDLPEEMKTVLLRGTDYPRTLTMKETDFIVFARKIDRNYQMAARFKALNPYKETFRARAPKDMRGLVYLQRKNLGAAELEDITKFPSEDLPDLKQALVRLCRNDLSSSTSKCTALVERAVEQNRVRSLFEEKYPKAQKVWKSFFTIQNSDIRRDVQWTDKEMWIPFRTPDEERHRKYLTSNIEAEYKWMDWSLKLNFGYWSKGPRLRFERGVMPHVDSVGGNVITMDSNQSIEEFESQWIIRHEFGHVLGLPDCYHEFYDDEEEAYVSYQLDTTDLMCSRAGNMNERIYKELKRVYE
jgi:hypothetical protein